MRLPIKPTMPKTIIRPRPPRGFEETFDPLDQDEGADGQQESGLGSGTEDFNGGKPQVRAGWRVGAPGRQRSARG